MWRREEQVCAEKFSELRMRIKRGKKRKARKEWEPNETRGAECKNKGENIIIVFTVQKNQNKKRRSICWLCVSNIHVEWKISQNNTQYMYVSIHTHSVCACTKEIYLCTHTHNRQTYQKNRPQMDVNFGRRIRGKLPKIRSNSSHT